MEQSCRNLLLLSSVIFPYSRVFENQRTGNACSEDGVTEERHTWDIFWCWFYFLTEVWYLDMGCNWNSPNLISWLVLFWIHSIFQYMIFYFNINTVYFAMLVFIYNFSLFHPNIIFELICHYDWIYQCFYCKFKI